MNSCTSIIIDFFTKKGIIIVGSAFGKTTIEDQAD